MNWIKRSIKLLYVVCMTIFIIGAIEFFLKNYRFNNDTYLDWLNSKPKAFRYESNYEVIKDSLNGVCKWPPLIHENGLSFYSKDFSCGGTTYTKNKRLTLPEIKNWKKAVHILGGSTVMGVGSDDMNTIPSLIQADLKNNEILVINHGVSSFVVNQQNQKLKALQDEIKNNDIVIYYDGGNDFWNGVMLANYDGTMAGYNSKNRFLLYNFMIRNWLSNNSYIYRFMSDIKHGRLGKKNACNVDKNMASKRVKESAEHYAKRIDEAKNITTNLGAEFIHFYQPTLFNNNITEYEKILLSQNPCWSLAMNFKKEYDQVFLDLSKESIDLTEILIETDTFFDYIHTSSLGNKIVSVNIVEHLNDILD